jgi:hypothetical protein
MVRQRRIKKNENQHNLVLCKEVSSNKEIGDILVPCTESASLDAVVDA